MGPGRLGWTAHSCLLVVYNSSIHSLSCASRSNMHYFELLPTFLLPLVAFSAPVLESRQTGDTRNDVLNKVCAPVTVVFARGTTETGNVGTLTGPPFFTALQSAVGQIAVQGVDYPADIPGFLAGGDSAGATTMAQLVGQAVSQCPQTKVVVSGYRYA